MLIILYVFFVIAFFFSLYFAYKAKKNSKRNIVYLK